MGTRTGTSVSAFGIRALQSRHREIRRLKRSQVPYLYGSQIWSSCWLLMDYLSRQDLGSTPDVLEIGCGWGLTGIFCAKTLNANVTCVDIDPEVFPYLDLHAAVNKVRITTKVSGINDLSIKDLKPYDMILGSDICFWDSMVLPLKLLINRALRAGVGRIVVADPGREPFVRLCDQFLHRDNARELEWRANRPRTIKGRILDLHSGS